MTFSIRSGIKRQTILPYLTLYCITISFPLKKSLALSLWSSGSASNATNLHTSKRPNMFDTSFSLLKFYESYFLDLKTNLFFWGIWSTDCAMRDESEHEHVQSSRTASVHDDSSQSSTSSQPIDSFKITHLDMVGRPPFNVAVCGNYLEHPNQAITFELDHAPLLTNLDRADSTQACAVGVDFAVRFQTSQPQPVKRANQLQVFKSRIPTIKDHALRLEVKLPSFLQHGFEEDGFSP